jgi:hypothetical protein
MLQTNALINLIFNTALKAKLQQEIKKVIFILFYLPQELRILNVNM